MQATEKDLEGLLKLQEVDVVAVGAQKQLDELPQRVQLQALAQKKQSVAEKRAQVGKMLDAARRKAAQIEDEAAILLRKRDDTQGKIDAAKGDYRAVQNLTRDLNGIAKRLEALEDERLAAMAKLEQVEGVMAQVESAIAALDSQAYQLRDSFQEQSAKLNERIADSQARHDEIASGIDPALLKEYLAARKRCGGVAMAQLVGDRCGVCRNLIDANRMLIVKREAPLTTCPSCRRLLIVT